MLDTLSYLDERYGGITGYLQQIGLTVAHIDALRDALVAPAAARMPAALAADAS